MSSHLSQEERCLIWLLNCNGCSQTEIADEIGRSQSVVSREISRNSVDSVYEGKQAQKNAELRRAVASSRPKEGMPEAVKRALEMLQTMDASPEQISGRLKLEDIHISHETIYRVILADQLGGGSLYKHLRHQKKKYNKRCGKNAGRGLIPNRVDIDQRPAIVEKKERLGDIEIQADTLATIGLLDDQSAQESISTMKRAVQLAESGGFWTIAARALNNLGAERMP